MYKPFISLLGIILTYISTFATPVTQETKQELAVSSAIIESYLPVESTPEHPTLPSPPHAQSITTENEEVITKQLILQLRKEERAVQQPIIQQPSSAAVKYAALTFDDGPSEYTPQILKILKENNVHATFFVLGTHAQKNQQTIQQIHAEGHVIGNHTWNHKDLTRSSPAELQNELKSTNHLLEEIIGEEIHLFRPPYGSINAGVRSFIEKEGMQPVLWNVDPADWNMKITSPIEDRVRSGLKDNSLILLHDGGGPRGRTVESLPLIIKQLRKQGYQLVTVPEYLELTAK